MVRPSLAGAADVLDIHDKLVDQSVRGQSLTGLDIKAAELLDVDFTDVDFSGSSFDRATISNCSFDHCQLIALEVSDGGITSSRFKRSRISADFSTSVLRDLTFQDCKIDSLNLRMTRITNVQFIDCVINDLDLYGAEVNKVTLTNCQVKKLQLSGAKLNNVDVSTSDIEDIDGITTAKGLTISDDQLYRFAPIMAQQAGIKIV